MDKNEEKICRNHFEDDLLFSIERHENGDYLSEKTQSCWMGFREGWEASKKIEEDGKNVICPYCNTIQDKARYYDDSVSAVGDHNLECQSCDAEFYFNTDRIYRYHVFD